MECMEGLGGVYNAWVKSYTSISNILHLIYSVLLKLWRQEIDISAVLPGCQFSNQLRSRGSPSLCVPTYNLPTPTCCIHQALMGVAVLLK